MSENQSEARTMRALVAEWAFKVSPITPYDNRDSWLRRVARLCQIRPRTMRALFYGEIEDPKHYAAQLLQIAANKALLAAKVELAGSPDRALADALRSGADGLHSVANRG